MEKISTDLKSLYEGMGVGFSQVVTLVVSATVFVEGLKSTGIINSLTNLVSNMDEAGVVYVFIFCGFILLNGFLSGSGNSALYALITLIPALVVSSNIPAYLITVPMQMASNLVRTLTPISAVIIIVSTMIGVNPLILVKRTAFPSLGTMIFTIVLSIILFS